MTINLTPFEQFSYSTIRIECRLESGAVSTGTGFFFMFEVSDTLAVPSIVTNKHVVEGAVEANLFFTRKKSDGSPDVGNVDRYAFRGFKHAWVPHPDPNIDLCAMPIVDLFNNANEKNKMFYIRTINWGMIPSKEEIEDFIGLERIVMVGYPNGIWDRVNNFPILRSGSAATNYRYDWNGNPEFLIDCACFPGSSGSPVFVCDIGHVHTRQGVAFEENRIQFLGILYAGPQHRVDGTVQIVPVPTVNTGVATLEIPNNLGIVIKARKLKELQDTIILRAKKKAELT